MNVYGNSTLRAKQQANSKIVQLLMVKAPELQGFDWPGFWLREVIFLGLPTLITIIAFRGGPTLRPSRLAVLLLVLLGLTVFNVILSRSGGQDVRGGSA